VPYVRCPSCRITAYSPISATRRSACPNCGEPIEVPRAGGLQDGVTRRVADAQNDVNEKGDTPPEGRGTRAAAARKKLRKVDDEIPQEEEPES